MSCWLESLPSHSSSAMVLPAREASMGILTDVMKQLVEEQRLGFVATTCPDGTPNVSPKGTTAVWDEDHLVFVDLCSPGTIANLRSHPVVEINVVDPIARQGYRFKGTATVLAEGELFARIAQWYRSRGMRYAPRHIVLIQVTHALELRSPAYDHGATESEVRSSWWAHHAALQTEWESRQLPDSTEGPGQSFPPSAGVARQSRSRETAE